MLHFIFLSYGRALSVFPSFIAYLGEFCTWPFIVHIVKYCHIFYDNLFKLGDVLMVFDSLINYV